MLPRLDCLTAPVNAPVPTVPLENKPLPVLKEELEQAVTEAEEETAEFIKRMNSQRSDILDGLRNLSTVDRFHSWYNSKDHQALLKKPGHERLLKLRDEVILMSEGAGSFLLDKLGDLLTIGKEVDDPVRDFYTDLPEHARG